MENNVYYWYYPWLKDTARVEIEYFSNDRTRAHIKLYDGCIVSVPIKELIIITDTKL